MKNNIIGKKVNKIPWLAYMSQGSLNLWLYADAAEWGKRFSCVNILSRKWFSRHPDWQEETLRNS